MTMKMAAPVAMALSLALLGACSKPASQTASDAGATATNTAQGAGDMASNAGSGATSAGGAVSPPQANGAINSDGNTNASNVAPASNSFTEAEAKSHIEKAGYTDVQNLTKTPDGLWTGQAKMGGKTVDVALDFKGAVTTK
jgi:putative membrane protein